MEGGRFDRLVAVLGVMEGLERTGHRPAHSDRAGNDRIQLLLGDHPLGDEVDRLAEQGGLQPVGDEPGISRESTWGCLPMTR